MSFSISKKIIQNCKKYSCRTAYHINAKDYSYEELKSEILKITKLLIESVNNEKLIGVFSNNDIYSYAALYACWYAGKTFVPLNLDNPVGRIRDIIEQTGIRTVLCSQNSFSYDKYSELDLTYLNIENNNPELNEDQLIFPDEEQIAYLLFTSGTTGIPKGVPIHFEALNSFLKHFIIDYDITENDKFLQIYDISFDGAVPSYLAPLCFGASVYTVPPDEIKYLSAYKLIREHDLTVVKMTPSILAYFKPFFKEMLLEKVRYSIFGGEALPVGLAKEWSKCVPVAKIQNVYGPTESTVFCLRYEWESGKSIESNNGVVSLGKSSGENAFIVIDKKDQIIKDGEKGELCVTGPQLFIAYWNPDQSLRKDKYIYIEKRGKNLKYYKTGDIVYKDKKGNYMFCGRIDSQVQIQGYRVELGEIEQHSRDFLELNNLAAIGVENSHGTIEIHLFTEGAKNKETELMNHLLSRLPKYMIPAKITDLPELPKSTGGKIDRAKLKKMALK